MKLFDLDFREKDNNRKDIDTIKWIYNSAKGQWKYVAIYAVLACALAFFGTLTAYGTRMIVNGANDGDFETLKKGGIYLTALVVIQLAISISSKLLYESARAKTEIKVKGKIFDLILTKDYSQVTKYHSGDILNRLTSDVIVITDGIMGLLPNVLSLITRLVMAVVIMVTLDPFFAIIFVSAGLFLFITTRFFRGYLKNIHKKSQETDGKVRSFFQEAVTSLLAIKVFNAYDQIIDKSEELMHENYKVRIKRAAISILANGGIQFVFSFGYLFALVWGGYRVYTGYISIGDLTAILQLVNQIQGPMAALSGVLTTYYGILASAERLIEYEEMANELDTHNKIEDVEKYYSGLRSINICDVTFKYNRDYILQNANAVINKGDFVAITGITGIGKSTLFKLILGVIYPQSGKIFIEASDGERIVDKDTRSLFSYVPQGNMLLSGTLYENITFMNSEKSKDEIDEAIRLSCAVEFISKLPDGLNTKIGERGMGLSEGQVQRIAIARAILYNAPILFLDEATSALDAETEKQLLNNLRSLKDRTLVIITHKKAALSVCNKEMRIEDKKIYMLDTDISLNTTTAD